jgi:hypothetical protein
MTGTPSQIEWAERLKPLVSAEFDRVAEALRAAGGKQTPQDRQDTDAILEILYEKRAAVLAHDQAGYFIHDWPEAGDRVRRLILEDARVQAIQSARNARRIV